MEQNSNKPIPAAGESFPRAGWLFSVFKGALIGMGAILPGILIGALGLLSPTLGSLAALPIPLIILPVIFTTFYTATRDVFGLPDGQPPRAPDTPVDAQHGG